MLDPTQLALRDIHVPPPISWWPLAPGWWGVIAFAAASLLTALAVGWWWRRTRLRRAAHAALVVIRQNYITHQDSRRLAAEVSQLCRQVALGMFGASPVAGLTGTAWLAQLDQITPDHFFTRGAGNALREAPYNPHAVFDPELLLRGLAAWLASLPPPGIPGPVDV